MRFANVSYVLAIVGAAGAACGDVGDLGHNYHHQCESHVNGTWVGANLSGEIDHTDPRSCPLQVDGGQFVNSAAIIYDVNAVYPNEYDTDVLWVTAYDDYIVQDWQGFWPMMGGSDYENFDWHLEHPNTWTRKASLAINFAAEGAPHSDWVEHRVELWSTLEDAIVVVKLDYDYD